jgi:hypothetical protein
MLIFLHWNQRMSAVSGQLNLPDSVLNDNVIFFMNLGIQLLLRFVFTL